MESILIAIGVLALLGLAATFRLERRLGRVEDRLGRLDEIEVLAQRVHGLAAELDRKELNAPLQAKLTEVTEGLRRLHAVVAELGQAQSDLRAQVEGAVAARPAEAPRPADLAQRVREHLEREGFERIQILSDVTRMQGASGRVVVEARRGGVAHKGHLSVTDGAVVEEHIRAAYSAFP